MHFSRIAEASTAFPVFGEKIILEATAMRLSTCWVGTSYDKKAAATLCSANDTLDCVIAIGHSDENHSLKERMMEYGMHRHDKTKESLSESEAPVPEWFRLGMDAVYLAPTAPKKELFFQSSSNNSLPLYYSVVQSLCFIRSPPGG